MPEKRAATVHSGDNGESGDAFTDQEAEQRAADAIRRSFTMPYRPQKTLVGQSRRSKSIKKAKQKV